MGVAGVNLCRSNLNLCANRKLSTYIPYRLGTLWVVRSMSCPAKLLVSWTIFMLSGCFSCNDPVLSSAVRTRKTGCMDAIISLSMMLVSAMITFAVMACKLMFQLTMMMVRLTVQMISVISRR